MKNIEELEEQLNSFDPDQRESALKTLCSGDTLSDRAGPNLNMHFHSFFSYNAMGYSPSAIAWHARKAGLYAAGLCDFDVLDGLEEFINAGITTGLRVTVNIETRAFFREYADRDISSPGEPGVTYIMGAGFARHPEAGSPQAEELAGYRKRARERNIALVNRINAVFPDIAIDYEDNVLPLTPRQAATERHIISAYINRIKSVPGGASAAADILCNILKKPSDEIVALMSDTPALEEALRAGLAKKGGAGYKQPSAETFPPVDDFVRWVLSCRAMPMVTWLDGTSEGEKDGKALLERMVDKGAAALNIIPDRNWNVSDPEKRRVKRENLRKIVEAAETMNLPINIGTEMNKLGLPFVDDMKGEVLSRYSDPFLRGAQIMVGHTRLLRYADFSYVGPEADSEFRNTEEKNLFFENVGRIPPLNRSQADELLQKGPEKAFSWFAELEKNERTS